MSMCRDEESKLKSTELKCSRCQYAETGKQTKIYRTKKLHVTLWADKESKVKYTELKYCRCQYAQTRKAK